MRQPFSKLIVVGLLAWSLYYTAHLAHTYYRAAAHLMSGAGDAQWQFAFFWAPVPMAIAFAAMLISMFARLPWAYLIFSTAAVATPLALWGLVWRQVY